jgi:hypothetical protein
LQKRKKALEEVKAARDKAIEIVRIQAQRKKDTKTKFKNIDEEP